MVFIHTATIIICCQNPERVHKKWKMCAYELLTIFAKPSMVISGISIIISFVINTLGGINVYSKKNVIIRFI